MNKERINELLAERYSEEVSKLSEKLNLHDNYVFFKCKNGCDKLAFELAYEYNFQCPECGTVMQAVDTNKEKRELKKRISEIKGLLN